MSNEEFDRRMAFIVDQQAQFASDIQRLSEAQTKTDQVVAQTGEIVAKIGEIVASLAKGTFEVFKDVNAKIDALVDSQIRLNDSQSRTDQTLRSLITVVDRYFSDGRNGRQEI